MTKNEVKYYSSLLQKKVREKEKKFLVEGLKFVQEGINSSNKCEIIFVTKTFQESHSDFLNFIKVKSPRIEVLKTTDFDKLTETKNSQGIVSVFQMINKTLISNVGDKIIVALENISDPGNMGTILRNCDWFGIRTVLLSPNCAEIYNPKVIRASAGSVFHLNLVEEKDFYQSLSNKKKEGYKIISTDIRGENIYYEKFNKNLVVVLSNEANGPTDTLLSICDSKISIPRIGEAESLNVASASAVILSELTR